MAFRSSKNKQIVPLSIKLDGGLNYAQSGGNIADNECQRLRNYVYDSLTGMLETRPGTTCVTAAALGSAIRRIYYYERSSTEKWLVGVSGSKLYYLNGTAWVEIGDIASASVVPSFLTFNSKLLIADGSSEIRTWDGTTYSTIATSPPATVLKVIKGRVVANSSTDPDAVYFSKAYDETDWNTGASAVLLRAGYGDNMAVIAFGVFGSDLLIYKLGNSEKKIYRINVEDATTSNWYVEQLSDNNCAQNHQSVVSAFNNVFYVDSNGMKNIKGVLQYGDLQTDPVGSKVNNIFTSSTSSDDCVFIPEYNAIWFMLGDRIFAYHQLYDAAGTPRAAYTDLLFNQGRIRSACQAGTIVYLAGHNGYLYKMDSTVATDETAPSTTSAFTSQLKTKSFQFTSDAILKRIDLRLVPKNEGAASLHIDNGSSTEITIKSITLTAEGEYLNDATGYIADATDYIYDTGSEPWTETSHNRVRGNKLAVSLQTTSGRVVVEGISLTVAITEGT